MAGFVARLHDINALADGSPSFVWRLQTDEGNATYLRPYDVDRILFNLSVWKSIEDLEGYVLRSAHVDVMRNCNAWFEKFEGRTSRSGGYRRGTSRRSTKQESAWPTSRQTAESFRVHVPGQVSAG